MNQYKQQSMATKEHFLYKLVTKEQAKAFAWSFERPNTEALLYPYIFLPIQPQEVKSQKIYLGLCYTDCHLVNQDLFLINYPSVPRHEILGHVLMKGDQLHNSKLVIQLVQDSQEIVVETVNYVFKEMITFVEQRWIIILSFCLNLMNSQNIYNSQLNGLFQFQILSHNIQLHLFSVLVLKSFAPLKRYFNSNNCIIIIQNILINSIKLKLYYYY
ncbi:unnamed protein product [Paramecium primaurelia]|uniref:Uncharacterized protein n=1 Tax=Paramecium primaurelia TaxID=5886 RepID=A0A8S1NZP1_PARPR|nr:unnamed protein product [Paramecium primaurelia]